MQNGTPMHQDLQCDGLQMGTSFFCKGVVAG